jgi:hypothetical protein
MKLEQFLSLEDSNKENAIYRYGIFLENHQGRGIVCDVYKMFDFYVTLHFQRGKHERATITASTSRQQLLFPKKQL